MEHLEHKQKVTIMIAVLSAMFFAAVNMTIVGTSLPKIVAIIGGMEYFNWVFTIYMLTATVTAMLVGKLSDIYGRKIFILIGISLFMIGAFLSGTSETIFQLIIYRGIQGFGGGMIMSTAFTTVGDLFSPRERGRWQGLFGAAFGLSSLFGPTLGGYIVDNFNWHWIFWIFLPIGFISFGLIWKLYPSHVKKEKESVDYLGSLALTLMIVTLLLGFSWAGNQYDWASFEIIGLFSLSLISLGTFIYIESKVKSPVIPLHLFKNKVFVVSNVAGFFLGMGMFGVIMYTPFFVQGVLGRTATISGLVEMVMTLAMVTCSIIAGRMITKTGKYKVIALVGLSIMAIGLFLNAFLATDSSLLRVILQLVIVGIGMGISMPVFQVTVQNAVKHKFLGVATSTMQVFRQIGGTIGVAIMGTVMGNLLRKRLEENKGAGTLPEGSKELEQVLNPQTLMDSDQLEQIKMDLPEQMWSVFDQLVFMLREALSYSLSGVFLFSAFVMVLAITFTIFLQEIPLRTSNSDEENELNLETR
jgi:EmrB/QacA subfamily drug resistance transporter